jgi:hypothetical protein
MVGDVLQEDELGLTIADDAGDVRPEVARVVGSSLPSGDAERLAWVAGSDEIHDATKLSTVEGGKVIPDRRRMKPAVFHTRDKIRDGIGFPFHVSDAAVAASECNSDAQLDSADAGTECEPVDVGI